MQKANWNEPLTLSIKSFPQLSMQFFYAAFGILLVREVWRWWKGWCQSSDLYSSKSSLLRMSKLLKYTIRGLGRFFSVNVIHVASQCTTNKAAHSTGTFKRKLLMLLIYPHSKKQLPSSRHRARLAHRHKATLLISHWMKINRLQYKNTQTQHIN